MNFHNSKTINNFNIFFNFKVNAEEMASAMDRAVDSAVIHTNDLEKSSTDSFVELLPTCNRDVSLCFTF